MGSDSSQPWSSEFKLINKQEDIFNYTLEHLRTGQIYRGLNIDLQNKEQKVQLIERISKRQSKNSTTLYPLYKCYHNDTQEYCKNHQTYCLVYRQPDTTLEQVFNSRRKTQQRFSDDEINLVIYNVYTALRDCYDIHQHYDKLQMCRIWIRDSVYLQDLLLQKSVDEGQQIKNSINRNEVRGYPSAQKLRTQYQTISQFDRYSSDLFSLGLIALQLYHPQAQIKSVYQSETNKFYENTKINYDKLSKLISQVKNSFLQHEIKILTSSNWTERKNINQICSLQKINMGNVRLFIKPLALDNVPPFDRNQIINNNQYATEDRYQPNSKIYQHQQHIRQNRPLSSIPILQTKNTQPINYGYQMNISNTNYQPLSSHTQIKTAVSNIDHNALITNKLEKPISFTNHLPSNSYANYQPINSFGINQHSNSFSISPPQQINNTLSSNYKHSFQSNLPQFNSLIKPTTTNNQILQSNKYSFNNYKYDPVKFQPLNFKIPKYQSTLSSDLLVKIKNISQNSASSLIPESSKFSKKEDHLLQIKQQPPDNEKRQRSGSNLSGNINQTVQSQDLNQYKLDNVDQSSYPNYSSANEIQKSKISSIKQVTEHDNSISDEAEYVKEQYEIGTSYEGYKRNGKRNGNGKFYYKEGSYYDGHWKDNRMDGYGTLYYPDGKIAYKGEWKDDQFHGKGTVFNDQPTPLNGPYDFTNFGKITNEWVKYQGELKNDAKEGTGIFLLTNGEIYQGSFVNDGMEGEGIFTKIDGGKIRGIWKNSILHKVL